MQSQQKRVKWSRGETAEALEERTDTGITQASVEFMENCIPDIYGNISRRPAIVAIPKWPDANYNLGFSTFAGDNTKIIPFYVSEDDVILIALHYNTGPEFMRIQTGRVVYRASISTGVFPTTNPYQDGKISFAQQNNYMIIANKKNAYKLSFVLSDESFTPSIELFKFSAGWYAPNGTNTVEVSNNDVTGLRFSGNFTNYSHTDGAGVNTLFSKTTTNVNSTYFNDLVNAIPLGSIIQMPNIGCYFRLEGYTVGSNGTVAFRNITFDGVLGPNDAVPSTGKYCKATLTAWNPGLHLTAYNDGQSIGSAAYTIHDYGGSGTIVVFNTASATGASQCSAQNVGGFQFSGWANVPADQVIVDAFGSILAPVVNSAATDSLVSVERGYVSVMPFPDQWNTGGSYPHPTKLLFAEQRLWAGGWQYSRTEQWSLVVGSQIARYNDFGNNYNLENEPITLDILTQFKEKIVHLIDYNGIKILTDSFEYAYQNGGVVKQSANGSLEDCEPIVFESLCLYCDSTGNQIRAMQYEFQSNVFESSCINQVAPHDLIWFPVAMAQYEDKVNNTGKYLFVVNTKTDINPQIAVCNFVPSNQANIWSRWKFINWEYGSITGSLVYTIINTKGKPIFMVDALCYGSHRLVPCYIDWEKDADLESTPYHNTADNKDYVCIWREGTGINTMVTLPSTTVNVYSNGVFQWQDTTNNNGALSKDISELTNVTVGVPINATIRSHPIDVGGKTKSVMKRIGKAQMSVHGTSAGAISINGKTGYMNPRIDHICFYGVTGMKDEIKYTITNKNGAMFHLESLLMNIEYGTLDS